MPKAPIPQGRFRIAAVAEKTGLTAATIRAWERRYGVPLPSRAKNNYRLYGNKDLADLAAMKRHILSGVAPAEAASLLLAPPKDAPEKAPEETDADV